MVNPLTPNLGIIVPLTGADPDTWGEDDVNPNMVSIDGFLGGVQSISLTSGLVTLTSPAGFTPTPGAGPTQSENRVLRFTGALSGNVIVTLPLPGSYLVENRTTGIWVVQFSGTTSTELLAVPQGECMEIYNDGANVRFTNKARVGAMEMWAGRATIPDWVNFCTVKPYLLCDGTVYNISDYPYLGPILGNQFGGNGLTTFGVPDMRGRVPIAYDGTGTRITTAGCGINGQILGASGGSQNVTLVRADFPNQVVGITIVDPGHTHASSNGIVDSLTQGSSNAVAFWRASIGGGQLIAASNTTGISASLNLNGGVTQTLPRTVQPSMVTGIWVVAT